MQFKTILVHLDDSRRAGDRLRFATTIAAESQAHVAALRVLPPLPSDGGMSAEGGVLAMKLMQEARKAGIEQARARFEEEARRTGYPVELRMANGDPAAVMGLHGRYADLVIAGQADPDDGLSMAPDFVARLVMNLPKALLVLPYAGTPPTLARRILIAWDGSREASRAVNNALPFLSAAQDIRVLSYNGRDKPEEFAGEPGADLALYLARHGLKIKVEQRTSPERDIGGRLLSEAADLDSDLIVMGAYSHSRAYEFVMGGVTRTVLEAMTVPVFMAH